MRKEVGTSSTEPAHPDDLQDVPGGSAMPLEFEPHADELALSSGNATPLGSARTSEDDEDEMIPLGDGYMISANEFRRHTESGGTLPIITQHFHQQSFTSEEDLDDEEDDDDEDGDDEDEAGQMSGAGGNSKSTKRQRGQGDGPGVAGTLEFEDDDEEDEDEEEDVEDEDDSASSCSHESPVSDMTMNMRMCNSEGYNTSPDAPNNWKSTPEMKLSARKRMMKQMRFGGTDMFVRADRRDLGVLLDAKKTIGKNGQRTRTNYKKGTSSSLTQNGDHEEGGTTVNDLLLSAPKTDPTPQRTTNWTTHGLDASIMNKIRPMVSANHKNRGRAIENGHLNAAASASIDSDRYCHRSVGAQTLPDDEYPSHYYYHTPNFTPHVVDSPLIKCLTPEDLPSKKKVIQDSLPEGTLRLVIQNFSQMTDTVRGPSKVVQDVPWRIMIMPRQHIVQKKGTTQKCLGFFLQCCPDAYSDSWSCQASAELRMIAQKPGVAMFHRKTNHVYTAKENDWGYSCFMTWAEILDEAQGYILNDVVILEVHVKAERAKNILSLGDFRKKINDYIRVAQMQCDRGLIDKAIDCNSQAMKFCKDKDPECFRRLQEQHKQLVEQKLKQSIARIERGGDSLANEADQASNITALRAAMTGNSTRTSAANRAKRGKDAKSTEKRRENDQNSDQTLPPDPTDFADGQQKTNTRNSTSSTVTSDKENDSLKETKEELRDTDLRLLDSSGELHTRESHCNGALTDEQIMSMADGLALPGGPQSPEELLKYLKAVSLPRDQSKAFENILCRSVKQELASHNSSSQTEFPPLSQLMTSRQKCARAAKANDSDAAESKTVETTQGAKPTKKVAPRRTNEPGTVPQPLQAKANAAAASLLAAGPKGDGGFTTTSGGMQPAVSGPTDANKLTYVPRGELSTVAKKRTYVDSLSDSSDNEPVYISTGDGNFFRAASPPGSSADENEPVPEFVMAFGDPAAVDEVAQEHYDLCEILHELQDSVFTFYSRICFEETPADSETKTDVVVPYLRKHLLRNLEWEDTIVENKDRALTKRANEKQHDFDLRQSRAVGRNRLIDLFQTKLQYPPLYMTGGTPSSERCLSEPSLPTSGLKLEKRTDVRDACLKQLQRLSYHLYDMTTRLGFNYLKTVRKLQERMVEWVNASEVGEQQAVFNRLHDFCQQNHLLNRRTNNVPKASLGPDEMPIMEDEDIMDAVFYAKNNKKMINHVSSIIDKIMSVSLSNHARLKPLINAILDRDSQQQAKIDALKKENDELRKESKTHTREKTQLLKAQKNDRIQMEAMKNEAVQFRNSFKGLQKSYTESTEEVESLRARVETLTAEAQQRESMHAREIQSHNDVKRNLSKELSERQSANQKLKEQVEDRNATIKKMEQSVSQDKRQLQKVTERAKAAEITVVEQRMEQAVRTLQQTRAECDAKLDAIEQRLEMGHMLDAEVARLHKDAKTLMGTRGDVNKLIEETRAEGQKNIEQLKEGKILSQLGRISFPKPPAFPNLEPMPPYRAPPPQVAPPAIVPLPTPQQLAGPPPSTPEFTPPGVQQPKHFVPPHTQAHMPVRTPLNVPPPQHSPAASAFRPLSSGPTFLGAGSAGAPVPPNFTSQPPPFMPLNGSIQHQHMAPYLSSTQPTHSELPIFMPSMTTPNPIHSNAMPGPIGSRPTNFAQPKPTPIGPAAHNVDPMKMASPNGPEQSDAANANNPLNTSPSASSSSARRGVGGIDGVRSLWENDIVREVFDNADTSSRSGNGNSRGTPNARSNDPSSNDIWGGYFSWELDK